MDDATLDMGSAITKAKWLCVAPLLEVYQAVYLVSIARSASWVGTFGTAQLMEC